MRIHSADTVILGGGVIGMTSALALADAGQQVILLEAGQLGQEASWAGGGIMSPLYPWRYPRPLDALLERALVRMPALVARLQNHTPHDPELLTTGLWVLGLDDAESEAAQAWANRQGWQVSRQDFSGVDAASQAALSSAVEAAGRNALWFPQVANIRNPRLIRGLAALLKAHPKVKVFEQSRVQSLSSGSASRSGLSAEVTVPSSIEWCVRASTVQVHASSVVCAAGAWSSELLSASGISIPRVQPALGQMLLLKPHIKRNVPMVLWDGRYIVPRQDGQVLVGSTVEYCGFKKRWADSTQRALLAFAEQLLGVSLTDQVQAHWAGLRPDAGQALPIIGEHPAQPGLWLNTGHFRNGLVLALGSAELLVRQMMGQVAGVSVELNAQPFLPNSPKTVETKEDQAVFSGDYVE